MKENNKAIRITEVSDNVKKIFEELKEYKDSLYGYVKEIEKI